MSKSINSSISQDFADSLKTLLSKHNRLAENRLKLILHVGTPKTGTTSLQVYLDKKQGKLRKRGILYPTTNHNTDAPKHQWFEKNLIRLHPQNLLDNFARILESTAENTHTILLSSEGIYNHWWDFQEESKSILQIINTYFDLTIWVWFREPLAFAESYYKQCLRNPVVEKIDCYGKDLSFAEILEDPWFRQHLNYMSFVDECDVLFGESVLKIFQYEKDTVETVMSLFDLTTPHDNPTPRKNTSMHFITADLYKIINRLELTAKEKEKMIPALQSLNKELTPYLHKTKQTLIDRKSKEQVIKISQKGMLALQNRFERN